MHASECLSTEHESPERHQMFSKLLAVAGIAFSVVNAHCALIIPAEIRRDCVNVFSRYIPLLDREWSHHSTVGQCSPDQQL
jgi:hypothetical protein